MYKDNTTKAKEMTIMKEIRKSINIPNEKCDVVAVNNEVREVKSKLQKDWSKNLNQRKKQFWQTLRNEKIAEAYSKYA
jgi:hypothetical protein